MPSKHRNNKGRTAKEYNQGNGVDNETYRHTLWNCLCADALSCLRLVFPSLFLSSLSSCEAFQRRVLT